MGQKAPRSDRILDPKSNELRDRIWNYARVGASLSEVSALLGVAPDTFRTFVLRNKPIARVLMRARAEGNFEIREAQHEMATGGEDKFAGPMLIWLGKQRLGQADRDAAPPEPIPGIEEAQDVRTFADLTAVAEQISPSRSRQITAGNDAEFLVIDTEATEVPEKVEVFDDEEG
jgi:hypothetical protein